jgi:hypothetical protein
MTLAKYPLDDIFLSQLHERWVLVVFDPQKRYLEICQQRNKRHRNSGKAENRDYHAPGS